MKEDQLELLSLLESVMECTGAGNGFSPVSTECQVGHMDGVVKEVKDKESRNQVKEAEDKESGKQNPI